MARTDAYRIINDRVAIKRTPSPTWSYSEQPKFRSLWAVHVDGQHCGWIVLEQGWGKPWELRQITADKARHELNEPGPFPERYGPTARSAKGRRLGVSDPHAYLAERAVELRDKGDMPTIDDLLAKAEQQRMAQRNADAEYAAKLEEQADELVELWTRLDEMIRGVEQGPLPLTSPQYEALKTIRRRLQGGYQFKAVQRAQQRMIGEKSEFVA